MMDDTSMNKIKEEKELIIIDELPFIDDYDQETLKNSANIHQLVVQLERCDNLIKELQLKKTLKSKEELMGNVKCPHCCKILTVENCTYLETSQ